MILLIALVFVMVILEERRSSSPEAKAAVRMSTYFLVV